MGGEGDHCYLNGSVKIFRPGSALMQAPTFLFHTCVLSHCRAESFLTGSLKQCVGIVLGSRYLQIIFQSRGVAVEWPTPRQGKSVSRFYIIGGVGVPLN